MPILPPQWRNLREALEISRVLKEDASPDLENYAAILRQNAEYLEDHLDLIRIATVPVGTILTYAGYLTPPEGFLLADGAEVPIDTYTDLYNVLTDQALFFPFGTDTDGSGNPGTTHFVLPNLPGPAFSISSIIKY